MCRRDYGRVPYPWEYYQQSYAPPSQDVWSLREIAGYFLIISLVAIWIFGLWWTFGCNVEWKIPCL